MKMSFALVLTVAALAVYANGTQVAVPNSGFEQVGRDNLPASWHWDISRNARAGCALDQESAHSGKRSVRLFNRSKSAPNVYGRLWCEVPVKPATRYRLSVWVKAQEAGGGLHFTDWRSYKLGVPSGTYDWRQITTSFETKEDQDVLAIGFNVVNVTDAVWLDDVSLEADLHTVELSGVDGRVRFWAPEEVLGDGRDVVVRLYFDLPAQFTGQVEASLVADSVTLATRSANVTGSGRTELIVNTGTTSAGRLTLRIVAQDKNGRKLGQAETTIHKFSSTVALAGLEKAQKRLVALESLLEQAKERGIPLDYPLVWYSLGKRFIDFGRQDVDHEFIKRACWVADEVNEMFDRAQAQLEAGLRGEPTMPAVPLYVTGPIEIRDGSFIADTRLSTGGPTVRRPVFFCGMGHFSQVRRDVGKFPDHGYNIIQTEFGPNSLFPDENTVTEQPITDFVHVLDRAAAANVAVNLLISPHYFPQWAMKKWPFLGECGGGFIKFCIDAPESRAIHERYLRLVISGIKDHPALHSICLSNEPIYQRDKCERGMRLWREWLERKHGTVEALNHRWRTSYRSFEDVPQPKLDLDRPTPALYDWSRFNAERFSGWHKWMADIIHQMAPDLPVHAKIMATAFNRRAILWGVDPAQFAALSQINGNDCWKWYDTSGWGQWANGWLTENMFFDLQKSVADKPIFNSEDHVIIDRDTSYIPPEHIQNVLWQGAVHGRGASTMWVWERTYNPESSIAESVMHRPACAAAVGTTNLDLLRCAQEVTAIQRAQPQVAILYSWPSIVYSDAHTSATSRIYEALNFTGVKIGFVTEEQAAAGGLEQFDVVVLAEATHVSDAAFKALREFSRSPGKRLVFYGKHSLRRDEYGRRRSIADVRNAPAARHIGGELVGMKLRDELELLLGQAGVEPPVRMVDAETGKAPWGVEWLCARYGGHLVVNLCNYLREPQSVRISGGPYVNLITRQRLGDAIELKPLVPVLAKEL